MSFFNAYTASFENWFAVGKRFDTKQFCHLLNILMMSTNTYLRRHKRDRDTIISFKCYCFKETKKNRKYCKENLCKFDLTVGRIEGDQQTQVISANLVHEHVMLPKELYLSLVLNDGMKQFEKYIRKEIDNFLQENKKKEIVKKDCGVAKCINLHVEELRPRLLWAAISKSSGVEIQFLLNQLGVDKQDKHHEIKKEQKIKKKFANLVDKIKKEIASASN